MSAELRDVRLPAALCQEAENKYGERFGGLEPFLIHILRQLVRDEASPMDQADQRLIEARLRDLGYL